jgi:integrase
MSKTIPKDLKPGRIFWVERGIYVRKTTTKGLQYGISYTFQGRHHLEIVGPTKTEAKHALEIRLGEIRQERFKLPDKKRIPTFKEFWAEYLEHSRLNKRSWKRDQCCAKRFLETFGGFRLDEITQREIERYKGTRALDTRDRTARTVTPRTVNLELSLLKHMFALAVEWDYIETNPAARVKGFKLDQKLERVLTEQEEIRLLAVSPPYLARLIRFALNTGCRLGEITSLKWSEVDLRTGTITVAKSKTGKVRHIPINSEVRAVLRECQLSSGETVFGYKGKPIQRFSRSWERAVREAGIPRIRFHDLRHTFATRLVLGGVDLVTVMDLMGHENIVTTLRYSHPSPEVNRAAVNRLCKPQRGNLTKAAHAENSTVSEGAQVVEKMVRRGGIEPSTHGFSGRCSTD